MDRSNNWGDTGWDCFKPSHRSEPQEKQTEKQKQTNKIFHVKVQVTKGQWKRLKAAIEKAHDFSKCNNKISPKWKPENKSDKNKTNCNTRTLSPFKICFKIHWNRHFRGKKELETETERIYHQHTHTRTNIKKVL